MSNDTIPLKRCSKCRQEKPPGAFGKNRTTKDGLQAYCKSCKKETGRQWYEENKDRAKELTHRWYIAHKDRARELAYRWREANINRARAADKRWYEANKTQARAVRRLRNKTKRDHNRASLCPGRVRNREKMRASRLRRRARKLSLPDNFTARDWQRALDYFNGCCAVCGRQLKDLFGTHKAAADHWIALTDPRPDNPGTVPWNIVPLCHGQDGCNNSKFRTDPAEWLERHFSKREVTKILARVIAYFEWVKQKPD